MAMIKICPRCNEKNPANALECEACGRDITKVQRVDEEKLKEMKGSEKKQKKPDDPVNKEPEAPPESPVRYRLCECGHKNPTNIRKCEQCGESLAGIEITDETGTVLNPHMSAVRLVSVDGGLNLNITEKETTLGRNCTGNDYFAGKSYVSGTHARIYLEPDGIYVEDLHSTNGTFIDGISIKPGVKAKLDKGKMLGLGGNAVSQTEAAFLLF